jgi:hypothetical protein
MQETRGINTLAALESRVGPEKRRYQNAGVACSVLNRRPKLKSIFIIKTSEKNNLHRHPEAGYTPHSAPFLILRVRSAQSRFRLRYAN